jgi:hypothetical protein
LHLIIRTGERCHAWYALSTTEVDHPTSRLPLHLLSHLCRPLLAFRRPEYAGLWLSVAARRSSSLDTRDIEAQPRRLCRLSVNRPANCIRTVDILASAMPSLRCILLLWCRNKIKPSYGVNHWVFERLAFNSANLEWGGGGIGLRHVSCASGGRFRR